MNDDTIPFDAIANGEPPSLGPARFLRSSDHLDDRQPPTPEFQSDFSTEGELEEQDIPDPIQLVAGLICAGDIVVVGGQSKSMKSWFAQHLGICVQYGRLFLGQKCIQGDVLYVNLELKPHTIRYRQRQIKSALAIPPSAADDQSQITFLNLRHKKATAATIRLAIAEYLKTHPRKFALIIIDPFYMLAAGMEEKEAGEMTKLLIAIAEIALDIGAAIVMPSHFAKGNASHKESMDRISGSGVMARNPDAIITITRLEEEATYSLEATLRALPPFKKTGLRWLFPVFTVDAELDPENLLQPKKPGRPSKATPTEVLDLLDDTGLKRSEWREAAMKRFTLSVTTAKDYLKELIDDGRAVEAKAPGGRGNLWYPSKETMEEREERARKEAVANAPSAPVPGGGRGCPDT